MPAIFTPTDFNLILFGSFPITFKPGSLSIQEKINQRSTMDFQREDDGGDVWNLGYSIDAYEFGIKRFGGIVNEVDLTVHEGTDGGRVYTVKCVDWGILADRRVMVDVDPNTGVVSSVQTWDGMVIADIVTQIGQRFLGADGVDCTTFVFSDPGLVATTFKTDCSSVTQAYNELQKLATSLSGLPYAWWIDFDQILHFQPWTQNPNSIVLSEQNGNCRAGSISLIRTGEQYTTRIIDRVAQFITGPFTETFDSGSSQALDGVRTAWDMQKVVAIAPTITLNGNAETVGVANVDTGMDFYWSPGSTTITATVAPGAGDTLSISYSAQEAEVIVVEDAAGIAARQAAEGKSGLYDMLIDSSTSPETQQDAVQQCQAELARRAGDSFVIQLDTPESDVHIGDQIFVDLPLYDSDFYLVRSMRTHDEGGVQIWRNLEVIKGPIIMDSIEYFRALLGSGQAVAGAGVNEPFKESVFNLWDTTVRDDVDIHLPVSESGVLVDCKGVFTKVGTSDFTFRVNQNQLPLVTITIPANTGSFQTVSTQAFTAIQMVENLVLSGDVVASDGLCSATVMLKWRVAALTPNAGMTFTTGDTSSNIPMV